MSIIGSRSKNVYYICFSCEALILAGMDAEVLETTGKILAATKITGTVLTGRSPFKYCTTLHQAEYQAMSYKGRTKRSLGLNCDTQ